MPRGRLILTASPGLLCMYAASDRVELKVGVVGGVAPAVLKDHITILRDGGMSAAHPQVRRMSACGIPRLIGEYGGLGTWMPIRRMRGGDGAVYAVHAGGAATWTRRTLRAGVRGMYPKPQDYIEAHGALDAHHWEGLVRQGDGPEEGEGRTRAEEGEGEDEG